MYSKNKLIESLDEILNSNKKKLDKKSKKQLKKLIEDLKRAKTKEEVIEALRGIFYLFEAAHIIKDIIAVYSG